VKTLTIELVCAPSSTRAARALDSATDRAEGELAGRTVWSAAALPGGRTYGHGLLGCLRCADDSGGPGTQPLTVTPDEHLRRLGERLEEMLRGSAADRRRLGAEDHEVCAFALLGSGGVVGANVSPDDVVVLHDPVAALLTEAIRELGAHAVWDVTLGADAGNAMAREAWLFLRPYTSAVDAYVMTWDERHEGGGAVERIAALMPSADAVAAKDIPATAAHDPAAPEWWQSGGSATAPHARTPDRYHGLGWTGILADVVHNDRGETVGGTLHARPAVAPR
jgi:hypothetical protein